MIIDMLFYLINKEIGKIAISFELGYIRFRGGVGKPPLLLDICASGVPYIVKKIQKNDKAVQLNNSKSFIPTLPPIVKFRELSFLRSFNYINYSFESSLAS